MDIWITELYLQLADIYSYITDISVASWSVFCAAQPLAQMAVVSLPILFFIMMRYGDYDENE